MEGAQIYGGGHRSMEEETDPWRGTQIHGGGGHISMEGDIICTGDNSIIV